MWVHDSIHRILSLEEAGREPELVEAAVELWNHPEFAQAEGQPGRLRFVLCVMLLRRLVRRYDSVGESLRTARTPAAPTSPEWCLRNWLALNVVFDDEEANVQWLLRELNEVELSPFTWEVVEFYLVPVLMRRQLWEQAGTLVRDPVRRARFIVDGYDPHRSSTDRVLEHVHALKTALLAAGRVKDFEDVTEILRANLDIPGIGEVV